MKQSNNLFSKLVRIAVKQRVLVVAICLLGLGCGNVYSQESRNQQTVPARGVFQNPTSSSFTDRIPANNRIFEPGPNSRARRPFQNSFAKQAIRALEPFAPANNRQPQQLEYLPPAQMRFPPSPLEQQIEYLRKAKTDEQRATAQQRIKKILSDQYDSYLQNSSNELAALEARLKALRDKLQSRKDARDELVGKELRRVIGEAQGNGWPRQTPTSSIRGATSRQQAGTELQAQLRQLRAQQQRSIRPGANGRFAAPYYEDGASVQRTVLPAVAKKEKRPDPGLEGAVAARKPVPPSDIEVATKNEDPVSVELRFIGEDNKKPIAGLIVEMLSLDRSEKFGTFTTNENGAVTAQLESGTYRLKLSAERETDYLPVDNGCLGLWERLGGSALALVVKDSRVKRWLGGRTDEGYEPAKNTAGNAVAPTVCSQPVNWSFALSTQKPARELPALNSSSKMNSAKTGGGPSLGRTSDGKRKITLKRGLPMMRGISGVWSPPTRDTRTIFRNRVWRSLRTPKSKSSTVRPRQSTSLNSTRSRLPE